MPYLISYDIESDKLRTKTSNQLAYYGMLRMQKSVFVGTMRRTHLDKLKKWLAKNILPALQSDDQIAILQFGNEDLKKTEHLHMVPEGWDEMVDPPSAIFI